MKTQIKSKIMLIKNICMYTMQIILKIKLEWLYISDNVDFRARNKTGLSSSSDLQSPTSFLWGSTLPTFLYLLMNLWICKHISLIFHLGEHATFIVVYFVFLNISRTLFCITTYRLASFFLKVSNKNIKVSNSS